MTHLTIRLPGEGERRNLEQKETQAGLLETKNDPKEIEARKYRDTLLVVGAGTIIFGLWTLFKAVSLVMIGKTQYMPMMKGYIEDGGAAWKDWYFYLFLGLLFFALFIEFLFKAFVGWAAISEGRGKKRTILYIVVAFLLIWGSFVTIIGIIAGDVSNEIDYTGSSRAPWETSIIELTSMVLMIEMVASGIKLRRLRRKEEKAAKAEVKNAA